jgi:hypothetical protein
LKAAYNGQSMQPKEEVIFEEETKDEIQKVLKQYTIADEILLRAKRPLTSKSDNSATLNYSGRVKHTSKKNA